MICILGTGFGLYGYLPALVQGCSQKVVLPERSRKKLLSRPELKLLLPHIHFAPTELEALELADGAVLALSPEDQLTYLKKILPLKQIKLLFLEKPLSNTPESSQNILNEIIQSGKEFRIGYLFRQTTWAREFVEKFYRLNESSTLRFNWFFQAHHFKNNLHNWKRSHHFGGGVIRFYGIHLIAFLAELGYGQVASSKTYGFNKDEIERWHACLSGPKLPDIEIYIDSRSPKTQFSIDQKADTHQHYQNFIIQKDPLDVPKIEDNDLSMPVFDRRVTYLVKHCLLPLDKQKDFTQIYTDTNTLWALIEQKDEFVKI